MTCFVPHLWEFCHARMCDLSHHWQSNHRSSLRCAILLPDVSGEVGSWAFSRSIPCQTRICLASVQCASSCASSTLKRPRPGVIRSQILPTGNDASYHGEIEIYISLLHLLFHSINGFLTPPDMEIPRARRPSGSLDRIIVLAGSIGLSGATCAASLAACSMASISSLQPAWSNGHTTMGWRSKMSRAEDICAWPVVSPVP